MSSLLKARTISAVHRLEAPVFIFEQGQASYIGFLKESTEHWKPPVSKFALPASCPTVRVRLSICYLVSEVCD
jgi:hypothetical protein